MVEHLENSVFGCQIVIDIDDSSARRKKSERDDFKRLQTEKTQRVK
jgi:hypothetical protein